MLYGIYQSAAGIVTSSYRQDVIANNLANAETTGFKRDLALFRERRTAARERGLGPSASNPTLEGLTGGMLALPTRVDASQGELEPTGRNLDCAIVGDGYFMVRGSAGDDHLTRNGGFLTDNQGALVLGDGSGRRVLDEARNPIVVDPRRSVAVDKDGLVTQDGQPVARLGVFTVPDPDRLTKRGGTLLDYPDMAQARAIPGLVRSTFLERSNVDPATELTQLMAAQRELEANANMIRYQDQTLARLVNDVAKIS